MVYSREQFEQSLTAHGDMLYRVALALVGDEGRAAQLLREFAQGFASEAPAVAPSPLDEPALLVRLIAVARASEERTREKAVRNAERRPGANRFAPFAIHHLTLAQRAAISLHVLFGYDGPRLASSLGVEVEAARSALVGAARALGPAASTALTDRVNGPPCEEVRLILVDPSAGSRHGAAARAHLAGCSLCRSFDHAWGTLLAAVEEALRGALRQQTLPVALRARMLALASPSPQRRTPSWRSLRLAAALAAVLALIATLVLPGFLRERVRQVDQQASAPVDAQTLIGRALARHTQPPDHGGVWHGRYETLWYFSDEVYAPLHADVWLDPRNPARHRLQLTHRDGGAPYELQIGDGVGRLAYALDAAYAPIFYGGLPSPARVDEPALANQSLAPAAQTLARDERLALGPWSLPPAYLRQARAASDLRLLGRQLDGDRLVQILSFSGMSPLGLPPDAPGATAERVTVLLALDSEDGLLRSATELTGPPGGAQVGRVTWRIVDDQWLTSIDQINATFAVESAWTGIGGFDETPRGPGPDEAMPLVDARAVGDPAALLAQWRLPLWMPAKAPAGVERAMLLWNTRSRRDNEYPTGLIYLGPGRRLVIAFNRAQTLVGEELSIGPWRVTLRPGRAQRYIVAAERTRLAPELQRLGFFDPSATLLIDATGFTRAEIEALIADLTPFDLHALASQDHLFGGLISDAPAARAALLEAAITLGSTPTEGAWHLVSRRYIRHAPDVSDSRRDPYHLPFYEGRAQVTELHEWLANAGSRLYDELRNAGDDRLLLSSYADAERSWRYLPAGDMLTPLTLMPVIRRQPALGAVLVELAGTPGALMIERLPGGGELVRHSEKAVTSARYSYNALNPSISEPFLFDLNPITMTTEVELSPAGEVLAARVYAESIDGARVRRTLVQSTELVTRETVPLDAAPAPLRDGVAPEARFVQPDGFVLRTLAPILRRETLEQGMPWPDVSLYVPTEGAATLLSVEEGQAPQPGEDLDYANGGDALREAIARRLAVRLSYRVPAGEYSPDSFDITITQGPLEPLRTFLRGSPNVPWSNTIPTRLTLAGVEVAAWQGESGRVVVLAELEPTLLVIESSRALDDPAFRALLAGLTPAR